jgi:four helix bundle protein
MMEQSMPSSSFKDVRVWQEAMKFAIAVYRVTSDFPKHEVRGLSQQLRRAAVPYRATSPREKATEPIREFRNFLLHERGSLLEVQTQLMIAQELQYVSPEDGARLLMASAQLANA